MERFEGLGVRVMRAEARFTGAARCGRRGRDPAAALRHRHRLAPAVPPIAGLDRVALSSPTRRSSPTAVLPEHLIVIGGGPIGIEMAQAHRLLGARVTVLDVGPLLAADDPELVGAPRRAACGRRHRPHRGCAIAAVERAGEVVRDARRWRGRASDRRLASAGRRGAAPNVAGARSRRRRHRRRTRAAAHASTARLRTTNRRVFAVGDVGRRAAIHPCRRSIMPASSSATRCSACPPRSITGRCPG